MNFFQLILSRNYLNYYIMQKQVGVLNTYICRKFLAYAIKFPVITDQIF